MRGPRQLAILVLAAATLATGSLSADNLTVGKDYYELRRFTDALASLKLAIQENPQAWEAYYYSGLIYQESAKPELALKYFASAWRAQPGNEKLGKQLTETYIQNAARSRAANGVEAAVGELESAIKGGFFSVDLVNQLLVHYAELNKWESTITVGNEVFRRQENLTLFPRDGSGTKRTHYLVGRACFETRDFRKALEHLEIATVGNETGAKELWDRTQQALAAQAKPYLDQGESLYRAGKMRESRAQFEKAIQLHRDSPFARKMVLKIDNVVKSQDLEGRAQQALADGNAPEALDFLREAALLYPENTGLLQQIKDIQAQAEAMEKAREAREAARDKARRERQENFSSLVDAARALQREEKFVEAQEVYRKALALFPDDLTVKSTLEELTAKVELDTHYQAGIEHFKSKKWADAIRELRAVDDKTEGGFRQSKRHLAMAYLSLNKIDEFEKYANVVLEKRPDDVELLYTLGDQAATSEQSTARLKEAMTRFKQIEAVSPGYRDVRERMNRLHWQIYWPEYAVAAILLLGYAVVYIFMKQRPRLMKRLFLADLDRRVTGSDWAGAMEMHAQMRQFELDTKEALAAHTGFARAFFEGRQYQKCISESQQVLRLAPRNKEIRVLMGKAYYAAKIISPEVLEYYLDVLEIDPDNRNLLSYVGTFCTEKKILNPTTMALMRQLAQLQPENDKVRALLLRGYLKDGDRGASAMALYKIERERNPQNLDVRVIMAEEHLRKGDIDKAISECEELLNINLNHPKTHQVMFEAYSKLDKLPELGKVYEQILAGEPYNTFIQSQLARLTGKPSQPLPVAAPPAAVPAPEPEPTVAEKLTSDRVPAASGGPVRGTQRCPKCGTEVLAGTYFCTCGAPL